MDVTDFMVMRVCVDDADVAMPGVVPGDPVCRRARSIRAGEAPPYWLRDFPALQKGCASADGGVGKINVALERNGVTRVASFYASTGDGGCAPPGSGDGEGAAPRIKGVSIEWHDDAYGFIMGSWSPVDLSSFDTPACEQNPESSRRFFRGWVIAPRALPEPGRSGWGAFPTHLIRGAPGTALGSCPASYGRALTTWTVQTVTFTGGRMSMAVVSNHFSRGGAEGDSPGKAMQIERTYWTREFGLSRWEKWAREDWSNPRTSEAAPHTAERLDARGRCGEPAPFPAQMTPVLRADELSHAGGWSQQLSDARSGQTHRWMMTLCRDYTNVDRRDQTLPAAAVDDVYWRE